MVQGSCKSFINGTVLIVCCVDCCLRKRVKGRKLDGYGTFVAAPCWAFVRLWPSDPHSPWPPDHQIEGVGLVFLRQNDLFKVAQQVRAQAEI